MTATPKSAGTESLNGSWVEVEKSSPFHCISNGSTSALEQIMLDVQNELITLNINNENSCSRQDIKQQQNQLSSRNSEKLVQQDYPFDNLSNFEDEKFKQLSSDWLWYWKQEGFECKKNYILEEKKLNLRQWAVRRGIFSKEILSLLLLSNVVSIMLGVGIGYTALIKRFL